MKTLISKGLFFTEEHRKKISESQKGRFISPEHRAKIAKTLTGKCYITDEGKQRIREAATGRCHSEEVRQRISETHSGKNHYRWNPDREEVLERSIRRTPEYFEWRDKVLTRDSHRCRLRSEECGDRIIVHHIKPWALYKKLRFDVTNGIALCTFHHPRGRKKEVEYEKLFIKLIKQK